MQLQPNTLFDDRYTLVRLIGRGGFSEVWLAQDKMTDLSIALKIYAPGQGMDNDGLNIFSQELKSVFHLSHANLLKPNHMGTWQNQPYLIMEYCSRGSITKQVGKMSEQEVWKVLHDVAAGLAYLHSKEIVHQDIKPDNILLDDEGNYRITDFGISTKARTTLRKSVGVVAAVSGGTMAYMGPERFSAQPAPTKASDIWALGATLFELLTGDVPFGEVGGGMQKNGAEIPDIVLPDKSTVSPELTHVIRLMLSPNTWDRPTADTLATWAADTTKVPIPTRRPTVVRGSNLTKGGSAPTPLPTPTPTATQLPEKNHRRWPWVVSIIVVLSVSIPLFVDYNSHQQSNLQQQHYSYAKDFCSHMDNADIDHIDELEDAFENLQYIKEIEEKSHYKGEINYNQYKQELKSKTDKLHSSATDKRNKLANIGGKTKKLADEKVEKLEKLKDKL